MKVFLISKADIKYRFFLSVPLKPRRLVFWFHGSTTFPPDELATKRPIELELALSVLPDDCIVVMPLIPKMGERAGADVVDPQCLSRRVVFDELLDPDLEIYNRPDREVLKILGYVREFVLSEVGIPSGRFIAGGFSAGGNFASLFAVLHPDCVTHVISIISCSYCLPVESMRGVRFDFPFGRGKLDRISGISPDMQAQRTIRYFIYDGELDENDPIEYLANNDADEAKSIKSVLGSSVAERSRNAVQFLADAGFMVEGHVMPGIGHVIHNCAALRGMLADFISHREAADGAGLR